MKYICLFALLISCTSYQPQFKPEKGFAYPLFVKHLSVPQECISVGTGKYCKWSSKEKIFYFKDEMYQSAFSFPKEGLKYQVHAQCRTIGTLPSKKVYTKTYSKKLSMRGVEWKTYYPKIEKVFKATGFEITAGETSSQGLKLKFGLDEKAENNVRRYLAVSGFDKEDEMWQSSVSSIGEDRDYDRILPVLLVASYDCLQTPKNQTRSNIISEADLDVVAMKHFLQNQ